MMNSELNEIRRLVETVLEDETLPACIQPDFLRDAVLAYPRRPGKSLRPALLVWCCELVGGKRAHCARAAAAIELQHNWTLIHDDIIDCDDTRRGAPSCHRLIEQSEDFEVANSATRADCAINQAMLAGDILHAWATNLLARCTEDGVSPTVALGLTARMTGMVTPLLVSGESLDVQFEHRDEEVSAERVLAMLRLKTAILLRFAAEAGVAIGLKTDDFTHATVQSAGRFAESAGLAFQIQDDVLGLFGDEARLKKPVGSDVRAGKPTLLYLAALERAGREDACELRSALGKPALSADGIERIRAIVRGCGALDHVRSLATQHLQTAREILAGFPESAARDRLERWTAHLLTRRS